MLLLFIQNVHACTGIIRKAENGDWVYARTMEFGADLVSFNLLFVPRDIDYKATLPANLTWKTKYAHVGFGPFGLPIVADGLNEKGLAAGAFYMPGWAEYQVTDSKTLSNLDVVSWILGNFATTQEVRNALQLVKVIGVQQKGIIPPLHYIVVDVHGDASVIEYVGGKLTIYDTPIKTITNSPTYFWHNVNARNYIGLKALNKPSIKIEGKELSQFGQGSGALGLPGDFTPPSRFIRAAFLRQVTLPGKDGYEEVLKTFKILNQFDIPKGAVREMDNGVEKFEETQWTSASDLMGLRYYFHTTNSRIIKLVNLKSLDLQAKDVISLPVDNPEHVLDLSSQFKKS